MFLRFKGKPNYNFWRKLPRPFFALAPMAEVTDVVFRQMFARYGKPDVMYTEFVSADGLASAGRPHLMTELMYTKKQRPVVAQIFGAHPEKIKEAAAFCKKLGFDGVDINMGCPDKAICKQGAGAMLMKDPELAKKIILAAKEGAGDMPISVKTRIGFHTNELETWLPALLSAKPAAITLHARTRKQMSKVPADWEQIKKAVEMARGTGVLIIGNGDIISREMGITRAQETGCDGVMVGRGIFGDPWFFNPKISKQALSRREIFDVMLEHTKLFEKVLGKKKFFVLMKKHFKAYVEGFTGAKTFRMRLMGAKDSKEIEKIVKESVFYREG